MTYIVEDSSLPPYFLLGDFDNMYKKNCGYPSEISYNNSNIFTGSLGELDPTLQPAYLKLRSRYKRINDIFKSASGVLLISPELKDLLEEFDPGLHQFIPLPLKGVAGTKEDVPRFILNVQHRQDTIVDELSNVRPITDAVDNSVMFVNYLSIGIITIDRSKTDSTHLWREKRYPGTMLLSDTLVKEMSARKMKFFKLHKTTDINL